LVLSAVYRLDPDDDMKDSIHRWSSGAAAGAVVVAAVGWSVTRAGRPRRRRGRVDRVVAFVAFGLVMLSPALDDTFLAGLHQRLVWAALISWSVVVAITELAGDRDVNRHAD
jgi:hypothetical protein